MTIAHVDHLCRGNAGIGKCVMEQGWIRFADTKLFRAPCMVEQVPNGRFVDIRIAIGDGADSILPLQRL